MKKVAAIFGLFGLIFTAGAMAHFETGNCGSGQEPRYEYPSNGHQHFIGCKTKTVGGVSG